MTLALSPVTLHIVATGVALASAVILCWPRG